MKLTHKTFFISTAIPYVNSVPHLGFALEIVQADVLARYHRIKGDAVFFLTGTDENALKNVLAARELVIDVKDLVDRNAAEFKNLREILNLSWDDFIRTTEPRHIEGAKKFWLACSKDIYKKKYRGLYCVGCEEFKTEKELSNGHCSEHPNTDPEIVEEENYFFRLSAYQHVLEELIVSEKLKIAPESRRNEMLAFIKQGLQDFSISRSQERARGWGIPVPGDDSQIFYVWFDALTNYITALGYAENLDTFRKYWQGGDSMLHIIGKGVNRFHTIYWSAMLLSAGIALPKQVFVHGYVTVDGQKISKSLGNVVSPKDVVLKYGIDTVRYFLLREIPTGEDGDFSYKKLEERYNGDLANGLGNLVARVATLGEKVSPINFSAGLARAGTAEGGGSVSGVDLNKDIDVPIKDIIKKTFKKYESYFEEIRLNEALSSVWELVSFADKYINEKKPWAADEEKELRSIILNASYIIGVIADLLEPFLPETAENIKKQIKFEDSVLKIKKGGNLFPRL